LKYLVLIFILFYWSGCSFADDIEIKKEKKVKKIQQSFNDVWTQVTSDPYKKLPQNKISLNGMFENAKRTLEERADIIPFFKKLAHPNGICLKGVWKIDRPNIYSGYFKNSTEALIIARASTAMSNTKSGDLRAFGFAGKIFPTLNPIEITKEDSANFFLIDNLGGTDAEHYTDVELSNEPNISFTMAVLKNLLYALKVTSIFADADKHSEIRQLYEVSSLGENKTDTTLITPKWMKIEAQKGQTVDKEDFRDELNIVEGKQLIFNIFVASTMKDELKDWLQIGTITFDSSVVSNSCDHRLHFHHPVWREGLRYQ